ncbi:uncharacterized protein LOC119681989 isoform X2 [Teleopsis dalmanni]|nr:uncharacterized protein LOC119681989 isoform X2 [Teleopsis dalmanni]
MGDKIHRTESIHSNDGSEDKDELDFFFHDVPYSSSSSTFSIPWANEGDAIKQNQYDWDQVENMLSGAAPLPEEPELRNEIQEWQQKFPTLLITYKFRMDSSKDMLCISGTKFSSQESLELDSISNLSLNAFDGNNKIYDFFNKTDYKNKQKLSSRFDDEDADLNLMKTNNNIPECKALGLVSVPIVLHKRYQKNKIETCKSQRNVSASCNPTSYDFGDIYVSNPANINKKNVHMPPITNLLEKKTNFVDLKKKSFVQLTQVQQAESAMIATSRKNQNREYFPRKAPLTTMDHLNNKSSIMLPSINELSKQQINKPVTNSSTEESMYNVYVKSYSVKREPQRFVSQNNLIFRSLFPVAPPSGRSISAAMLHQRPEIRTFLPNSASKFKMFN